MEDRAGDVLLLGVLAEQGELGEGVRLRIAIDLLAALDDAAPSIERRSDQSQLRLERVLVNRDGESRVDEAGDSSGAGVLVWEVLAGRKAPGSELGRVHDLVDEIHPDVDDAIVQALEGKFESIGDLLEALETAADGRVGSHDEVLAALAGPVSVPPSEPPPALLDSFERHDSPPAVMGDRAAGAPVAHEASSLALRPPPTDLLPSEGPIVAPRSSHVSTSGMQAVRHPPSSTAPDSESRPRPLVLVISTTETDDGELARGLRAKGFDVAFADRAETGFEATRELEPACVVCDMELPDATGDRVVRTLRNVQSSVATTPFMLLASPKTTSERIARFSAGADVHIMKPYVPSNVVSQVVALHEMSVRLRSARSNLSRFPDATSKVFQGSIAQISVQTILTVVDMERRTGMLEVRAAGAQIDLSIISGHATHGLVQGKLVAALDAARALLKMKEGTFSFRARKGFVAVPDDAMRLCHVLVEATRLSDEQEHAEPAP